MLNLKGELLRDNGMSIIELKEIATGVHALFCYPIWISVIDSIDFNAA